MKFLVVLLCGLVLVNLCVAQDEDCCADLEARYNEIYKKNDAQIREFQQRYYALERKAIELEARVTELEGGAK